jgi:mevalonate pyrophosphate decarboxylase
MQTSELLSHRLQQDLPAKHIDELKKALDKKDFASFATLTMRESN